MTAKPLQVDFGQLVRDLRDRQLHPDDIGAACGVTGQQVRFYQQGQQPRHAVGEALIALWVERTGQSRDIVPMYDGLNVDP